MKKMYQIMKYRRVAYAATIALFVVFIIGTIYHGGLDWGIDFNGGVKLTAQFEKVSP